MAERSNAISEITRFWLQARHGCAVYESLPVPVKYCQSDIDFLAIRGDLQPIILPGGLSIGPRIIVEAKDEHDWEPRGKEFGQLLEKDLAQLSDGLFVPRGIPCKFTMLRQEHFEAATKFFGTDDLDRLFIVHALDEAVASRHTEALAKCRIHFLTIREVVGDLFKWYVQHPRRSGLRHTLVGDIWHLLVGFCGCEPSAKNHG